MQYTVLVDNFGGLNTYMAPDKVGPGGAIGSFNVDISNGSLRNRFDDTKATLGGSGVWTGTDTYVPNNSKTIVPWGIGALGMTGRYAVARYAGRLYRSHRGFGAFPSDLDGIQYTSSIGGGATPTLPTWDILGVMYPGVPTFAASVGSSGNVPTGTITYYCTFSNDLGHESPPASVSVNLTTASQVTLTLPVAYAVATFSNNSTTITVSNAGQRALLRKGMRITGVGIQADTYITNVSGASTSVTISKPTTAAHTGSGNNISDPQVTTVRIYRQGGGITSPLLVHQTSVGTASFTDNKLNGELTDALTTIGTQNMPSGIRDISISPSGVLLFAAPGSTVVYMSVAPGVRGLYDPSKSIAVPDSPLATIYALNRFICPTIRGAFTLSIEDAFEGLPILEQIDDTEPCQVSYFVYPVDIGGEVWWNTNKGIVSTNGSTIQTITRYTFNRTTAESFVNCYGADFYNGEYIAFLDNKLYSWTRQAGWTIVNDTMLPDSGCVGFHISQGCTIYTGCFESPAAVRLLYKSTSRVSNGVYTTGAWTGEKTSSLKKFRKLSAVFSGNISIQPYIDEISVGSALTASSTGPTRVSWWLPSGSGSKGRSITLEITLTNQFAEVEELGVWVGEQREPMP